MQPDLCVTIQDHGDHVDGANCNPQEGSRCTTPIKSRENQGLFLGMLNSKQVCKDKVQQTGKRLFVLV